MNVSVVVCLCLYAFLRHFLCQTWWIRNLNLIYCEYACVEWNAVSSTPSYYLIQITNTIKMHRQYCLLSTSLGILATQIIDVDDEAHLRVGDHIPHLLLINSLVLLQQQQTMVKLTLWPCHWRCWWCSTGVQFANESPSLAGSSAVPKQRGESCALLLVLQIQC